jgi:hypothetical protein
MRKISIAICGLLFLTSFVDAVTVKKIDIIADNEAAKKAFFAQPAWIWGTHGYLKEKSRQDSLITLSNSKISFVLHIIGKKTADGKINAQIGMIRPSHYNWYGGGFINFKAGQTQSNKAEFEISKLTSNAEVGSVEFKYKGKDFSGVLKFSLLEDDDKLLASFTPFNVAQTIKEYIITLSAYPSAYGGNWKKGAELRQREALTSSGKVFKGRCSMDKADNWLLFYDKYFEVISKRGHGPCAFMYNPKNINKVKVNVGNYGVKSMLYYKPTAISTLIFWDMKGWTNEKAKEYMNKLEVKFK